ncbi:sensor histidine kinase [Leekyejoonella antrihumi]|uniref:sensor histidine kinase n=1 Tax=Leekyejoonella antrihumi TaxID=1660198 RepID=UPI001648D0F4|nr:histidine kinase [Leekyejoonella antrihumi]
MPGRPANLTSPWGRVHRWAVAHPVLVDLLLVLLLEAWATRLQHRIDRQELAAAVLSQLLILPLAIRRIWPWRLMCYLCAVGFVQWLLGDALVADAALLIGLYTVAVHDSRRRAWIAAGILEVGVIMASIRFAPSGDSVAASLVFLTGMVAAALFGGITLQVRRQYVASMVERAAQLERERDQQLRLAATAERNRIAREMHDVVAHSLSVIITLADAAVLADDATGTELMSQVAATGRTSMAEMRQLLGILRDDDVATGAPLTPQPALGQLGQLVEEVRSAGLPVTLSMSGQPQSLSQTRSAAVYRIVQEGLTNVLKHAIEPTRVAVHLSWSTDLLKVVIQDDGHPGVGDAPGVGHGVTGMRERAAVFGGTLDCGPRAAGWRVDARLPLAQGCPSDQIRLREQDRP